MEQQFEENQRLDRLWEQGLLNEGNEFEEEEEEEEEAEEEEEEEEVTLASPAHVISSLRGYAEHAFLFRNMQAMEENQRLDRLWEKDMQDFQDKQNMQGMQNMQDMQNMQQTENGI